MGNRHESSLSRTYRFATATAVPLVAIGGRFMTSAEMQGLGKVVGSVGVDGLEWSVGLAGVVS
jgi:hypothetical protein